MDDRVGASTSIDRSLFDDNKWNRAKYSANRGKVLEYSSSDALGNKRLTQVPDTLRGLGFLQVSTASMISSSVLGLNIAERSTGLLYWVVVMLIGVEVEV
jgi:hypothetical protein